MSSAQTKAATFSLLRTKLHRPQITQDLISRGHLLDRLSRRRQRPLTLVSASAGYGKTTLISSWLERMDGATPPVLNAWLSLDKDDNDLNTFLNYFLAAIQTVFPEAGQETAHLLRAPSLPPLSVLSRSLINELDQIETPFILVLDDYHYIQDVAIHELLTGLLRHPPRSLHLVLVSRRDPPLPLTKLRARGRVTEIRLNELRFTVAETSAFLQKIMDAPIDEAAASILVEKTEGWVTGLRLAILTLRHRGDVDRLMHNLSLDNRYVTEYLLAEVLEGLSADIRDFLLKTSILDRLCGPLCDAVCFNDVKAPSSSSGTAVFAHQRPLSVAAWDGAASAPSHSFGDSLTKSDEPEYNGRAFLEWLQERNLFTVSLDDQGYWYRYHHLFQSLLQRRLEQQLAADDIARLHMRASSWLAEKGMIDEALRHSLAAGDVASATRLLEQNVRPLLNADQWHVLQNRLAQLPADVIQQRPELLIAKAWVSFHQFALRAIPPILENIETILDDDENTQPVRGEVDFFWGHHLFWQGENTRSLEFLQRALQRIPEVHHLARGETELFWGVASQMSGHETQAVRTLNQWLYYGQTTHPGRQTKLLGSLIFIHVLSGKLNQAAQVTQQAQDMAQKHNNSYVEAWASYLQAFIHYCWNDLENARYHFARVVEQRYVVHKAAAIDGLVGLALTHQALGQRKNAEAAMALLLDFADETNDPAYITIAHSCQARLSLLQGDLPSALRWLQTADMSTDANIMFYWLEIPRLTQCRVLIAHGSEASLHEATEKLQKYRQQNEAQHNTRQLIDILVLLVLANLKQSKKDEARVALERAIGLAEPGGWIRPFVEVGPELASLLGQLRSQGIAPDYVDQILAACGTNDRCARPVPGSSLTAAVVRPQSPRSKAERDSSPLIEPLTDRELEVLSLFEQRLTNKEIAQRLTISPGTVKRHAENIYRKLDVQRRAEAVSRARELGITHDR